MTDIDRLLAMFETARRLRDSLTLMECADMDGFSKETKETFRQLWRQYYNAMNKVWQECDDMQNKIETEITKGVIE